MSERYNTIEELLTSLPDTYDLEAIQMDYENGNVDLDAFEAESYYMPLIVAESYINGQIKQATEQFSNYGLVPSMLDGYLPHEDIVKLMEERAHQ